MTTTRDILIIEDDAILRDLLVDWLEAARYRVRVAVEGAAGLAEVQDDPPSLVITDIHMPGIDGAAVIAEIKRCHPAVAVIAISGRFRCGSGLTPEDAIRLGAARALAKPFNRNEMVKAVADLVGRPVG